MEKSYQLEKTHWTDDDFELMNWHDCPIHALSFDKNYRLLFDIDYIFKWVLMKNKRKYNFWISPCTLIFDNVYDIKFESPSTNLVIDSITRENPQTPKNSPHINISLQYDWVIETTVGEISFRSVGFRQYVRQAPVLIANQQLDMKIRNGISFSQECRN